MTTKRTTSSPTSDAGNASDLRSPQGERSTRRGRSKRGFGRLDKLPSGKWRARYLGPDGQVHSADHTFVAKIDADGWLVDVERSISRGEWQALVAPRPALVNEEAPVEVVFRDLARDEVARRDLTPRTRALYESLLDRLIFPSSGIRRWRRSRRSRFARGSTGWGRNGPRNEATRTRCSSPCWRCVWTRS